MGTKRAGSSMTDMALRMIRRYHTGHTERLAASTGLTWKPTHRADMLRPRRSWGGYTGAFTRRAPPPAKKVGSAKHADRELREWSEDRGRTHWGAHDDGGADGNQLPGLAFRHLPGLFLCQGFRPAHALQHTSVAAFYLKRHVSL